MVTVQTLDSYLGKHIRDICGNGYVNDSDNHCAHFVSHVLNLKFGATCHMLGNGKGPAANVRVQEVFGRCSKAGTWESRASTLPMCLVFITNAGTELTWGVLRDTQDRIEGRAAFSEKRRPKFVGR